MKCEESTFEAFEKLFEAINKVKVELVSVHPLLRFFMRPDYRLVFNMDIDSAPKSRLIEVYDPKPYLSYGPDIHKAIWSEEHNSFVAVDCDDLDPFDVRAVGWRELPSAN